MKNFFILFLSLIFSQYTFAQIQKVVADKIVAQVGDKIILQSDIANAIADLKRQSPPIELSECEIIERSLIQKALYLQALKDSLEVSDEDINAELDQRIRYFINMYGSQQVVEEMAGKSIYQLKEDFRSSIKESKLVEQMRRKILENVKITPIEVKSYFDKIPKDSLPFYESELQISQIIVYPKANREVDDYVMSQLYDIKRQVESGSKTFDQLAKLYSDDPAVKENGGQYTLNRNDKGVWDPTFLSTAFKLKEGQISNVIKSKFGYHIIQLVSRSGDDAIVKHILKIPPVTDDEINEAKGRLDSVRLKIMNGEITFNEAVSKYSEDDESKFTGGNLQGNNSNILTIDQLDKDVVVILDSLKVGEISKPREFVNIREQGKKAVRILYLRSKSEPHRENMKDDYDRIATRALNIKKEQVMRNWFKEYIPTFYVKIDKEFDKCANIEDWQKIAAKNKF